MTDRADNKQFVRRLAHLRSVLAEDTAEAGIRGGSLLEEVLESAAQQAGYRGDRGSIGRYVSFLRGHNHFDSDLLTQAEGYAQVRNCIAHTYGLQTSAALAGEILDFLQQLIGAELQSAAQLMNSRIFAIAETALLREARDLMLREKIGRLPVMRNGRIVVTLLTSRDIVAAEAQAESKSGRLDGITVAEALPKDARKRIGFIDSLASADEVIARLRKPGIEALIVTEDGSSDKRRSGLLRMLMRCCACRV
ncbi:CBS domain-containing protein [Candidatus Gracilibacteria bacterium]|nr:CBS domain-containing protein [Candidatus Gracilibacteria bacterium]